MSTKVKKDKGTRPGPKPNRQIPNSLIRPFYLAQNPTLDNARNDPFYGCWIMEDWQENEKQIGHQYIDADMWAGKYRLFG